MKVKTLIDLLSKFPPDLTVVVDGYEQGYDDPATPYLTTIRDVQGPGQKGSWWAGRYDDPSSWQKGKDRKAVVLGRPEKFA